MATIIVTGGGTAGHCIPILAILPYLKNNFDKIYYIGSKNGIEKSIIEKTDIPYYSISCAKLHRAITLKNLKIPFSVFRGVKQAEKLLDKLKPDVIFSKGGFVAIPTVLAAKKKKIPIIIHESDYTIGLANKISARYSTKVLTSFPDTASSIKNGEYVGSPLRQSLFKTNKKQSLEEFGFSGKKPILLVTGGSLGAQKINSAIRNALPELLPKFDILHICGKNNIDKEKTLNGYIQKEFISNIENAFSITDVCVTRAGSNTLFELMSLKIPCVLIPLPKGNSRGDQVLNASYFQKQGLATVLPQNDLTTQSLVFAINCIYANRFNVKRNFEKFPIPNACPTIAKIITDCVK